MSALYVIDGVRVMYATAKKEFASDAKEGCSYGTASWIINPEAGEHEPHIYTYSEKMETIPDSAVKSNNDMDEMVKAGRRYMLVLAKSSEGMTIVNYNQTIKDALEDVANVVACYRTFEEDAGDGSKKVMGSLSMNGIHSLDRVFCVSPALDMRAYSHTEGNTGAEGDGEEAGEEAGEGESSGDSE